MVNFVDINNETEFLFYLIRNTETKNIEILMYYDYDFYRPLMPIGFGVKETYFKSKLISPNICNDFITKYIYKKQLDYSINYGDIIIQVISIIKSNIKVKFVNK